MKSPAGLRGKSRRNFPQNMVRPLSARIIRRRRIGRRSRPVVVSVISITTTPIFQKNRPIRATIFPRCWRWLRAWVLTDATPSPRPRWPMKCNAVCAMRLAFARAACAAMRQARVGELSHWKGVAFANAARHGVYSALLARAGMTGPAPIFEGQMGFEKELGVSLGNVGDKFAVPFPQNPQGPASMILNTSIKYWPAEYHSQSAIEAALFLREQIDDVSQIASVNIESHDASIDIIGSEPEKWKPETRETADHSLPYITAIALIDGEVTDKQFARERFADREVWKFLENVKVARHGELSGMYPQAVANIVHIDLVDGKRLTKRVDYPIGHAKNPLKDSEVEEKFFALVEPAIGNKQARKIIDLVWKLDEAKNVDDLMKVVLMPEK